MNLNSVEMILTSMGLISFVGKDAGLSCVALSAPPLGVGSDGWAAAIDAPKCNKSLMLLVSCV
jgi:hypothetical protein